MTADHGDMNSSPAGGGSAQTQPFAREGHLTGRPIEEQMAAAAAGAQAAGVQGDVVLRAEHEQALAALAAERDAHLNDLQRLAAEFDNFRKRSQRERELAASAADAKLLGELVAVLDDFERAREIVDADGANHDAVVEGVAMVHDRLLGVLAAHGLEEVPAEGIFDPNLHEAMLMQPAQGVAEGTILQVLQKGWRIGDRIVRHSRVIVAGNDSE